MATLDSSEIEPEWLIEDKWVRPSLQQCADLSFKAHILNAARAPQHASRMQRAQKGRSFLLLQSRFRMWRKSQGGKGGGVSATLFVRFCCMHTSSNADLDQDASIPKTGVLSGGNASMNMSYTFIVTDLSI